MLERACVRVPGSVGVCMRIRACSLANPTRNAYEPCCDVICGPLTPPNFSPLDYLINGTIFGETLLNIKCVF